MQEQRLLERTSTRGRPDVGNVLTFCSSQAGFRVRSHLYNVCMSSAKLAWTWLHFRFIRVSFQVFQITALALRGPLPSGEKFTVCLDRVAIPENTVRGVLLCVQDFVRDPVFTQRSFFSETGVEMLSEAAAISNSITSSSVYVPCSAVESESSARIISDLKTCFEKVLERRRMVKDTSEQWYRLGAVRPSSGESSSQYGVRFQLSWRRGKLTMCLLLLRHIKSLVTVVVWVLQEKGKRKFLTVQSKFDVNLNFLVRLSAPVNAL